MRRRTMVLLLSVLALGCASIPPPDPPDPPEPEAPKRPTERHRGLPIPETRLVERGFVATRLQAVSGDLPVVDARCLDPPPQWQEGDTPWDGSSYEIKFCVPHESVTGVAYHVGDMAGCGIGAGYFPEAPGNRWYQTAWLTGLDPGEVVVWPVLNTLVGVHLTTVACAVHGPDGLLVSDTADAMMDFPGPPEPPPPPEPVAGVSGKARVVLAGALAGLGTGVLRRRRAGSGERESRHDATATGGRGSPAPGSRASGGPAGKRPL